MEPIEVGNEDGHTAMWTDAEGNRNSSWRAPTKRVVGYKLNAEAFARVPSRCREGERPVSQPKQTCQVCGRSVICEPTGRGFPPEIAKRKLAKYCVAAGHESDPQYTAGFGFTRVVGMTAALPVGDEHTGDAG